jgi:hypothetical protein
MRESQDASVSVLWVGDGSEPKVGELCRNFSSALRGFGFNYESLQCRTHIFSIHPAGTNGANAMEIVDTVLGRKLDDRNCVSAAA